MAHFIIPLVKVINEQAQRQRVDWKGMKVEGTNVFFWFTVWSFKKNSWK